MARDNIVSRAAGAGLACAGITALTASPLALAWSGGIAGEAVLAGITALAGAMIAAGLALACRD